ncbi:Myb-like transcription factor [Aspergillus ustus]|uniref:Myb-like transcription factor n=1 Tax=Aspergillus ustus TaxID=40382 RepID=A0A0C1E1A8_ASPUT|nr:Myb-like transcription factor [Aspergillus ustus]
MNETPIRRRWWTQDEDQILQEQVKSQLELDGQQGSRNWSAIAEKLPGRSNKDCRKRWTKISLSSRKGTWSGAEDHLLRKAVAKVGFQWTKVAEMVGSRHPDQCAKRWHHSLDPNVKRGPWAPEEDAALLDAVHRIGRDWKEIGRELFPSRSTTDIKNRYVILNRRRDISISSRDNSSTIDSGACSDTQIMDPQDTNQMDLLTPGMGTSLVATPCESGIFNLTPEDLTIPFRSELLPPYLFENPPNLRPTDIIPSSDPRFGGPYLPMCDVPDWATSFDAPPVPPSSFNLLSPPQSTTNSEIESRDPSLLMMNNGSVPDTPYIPSDTSDANAPSTLVLEDLRPETVNLVIDTLLRTNSKFGMRLYNTGS